MWSVKFKLKTFSTEMEFSRLGFVSVTNDIALKKNIVTKK
jgi:hypothetical protein